MDNITKDNKEELQNQPTGEIFSGAATNTPVDSAYQEATTIAEANTPFPEQPYQEIQSQPPPDTSPPPSFIEPNGKKKFIILGLFAVIIIILLFLIFNLFGRKTQIPQKITLNYWGLWEDRDIMQPVIDDYKKNHSNIDINYTRQDPKQYRDRLKASVDRGEGPDIFRFHNTWLPMLKNYLSPVPKNIYSDAEFEKIFFPVVSSDLKTGNNYYGIPLMIDGLVLFYNEEILKGANVAVPQTWEEVQKIIPKLTVKEKGRIVTAGIAMGTAENIEHFSDILGLMMLQNGTKLEKSLFNCVDANTVNCGVETLTYYRRMAEVPNNSWDETLDNSIVAFAGGKVAMIIAPTWQALTIKSLSPNLNFKIAKVPQLPCDKQPCVTINWATYWVEGVSGKSKYQKEAWDFLKYLSDPNTMKRLYELETKSRSLFGEAYSRIELAKSLSDHPYLASLIAEAPTMKSSYMASRTNDGDTGLNSRLITYLKNAVNSLSQGVSVETALKTADEGFKQVYMNFNLITPASAQ